MFVLMRPRVRVDLVNDGAHAAGLGVGAEGQCRYAVVMTDETGVMAREAGEGRRVSTLRYSALVHSGRKQDVHCDRRHARRRRFDTCGLLP